MEEIDIKNIELDTYINSGYFSNCYLSKDNELVKLIKDNFLFYYDYVFNKEHIKKLSLLNNDSIIAPQKMVVNNSRLIGYITKYIDGVSISNIDINTKIKNVLKAYKKLKEDIISSTKKNNFLFIDVNSENILYDGTLKIIDLDLGIFDKENAIDKNLCSVEKTLFNVLFSLKSNDFFRVKDRDLLEIYKYFEIEYESSLIEYFDRIFNIYDNDDFTIKEIKKIGRELVYK